jgi:hypothetical protein
MDELKPGTELANENGRSGVVVSVDTRVADIEVFNLEVGGTHNYFVGDDERLGVLVHNGNPCAQEVVSASKGGTPLKRLHPDSSLKSSSLDYWRGQSTDDIVGSLSKPGDEVLRIRPDGTVLQGNHRIKVLEERGFDTSALRDRAIVEPKESLAPWE